MSFGFSPSDILALVNIARKTYRGWKSACGEYADITTSLDHLLILLERIEDEAEKPRTAIVRNKRDVEDLGDIIHACNKTVRELHAILTKFQSLGQGKSREKNWDRIRFGNKTLDSLRSKIQQHGASLAVYLDTVGLSSLARIESQTNALSEQIRNAVESLTAEIRNGDAVTRMEQVLGLLPDKMQKTVDCLVKDINSGRREGSIMTTYSDDEKDVWRQFRRELIGEGFRSSEIHKLKPRIKLYLRVLAERGLFEEAELSEADLSMEESLEWPTDRTMISQAKVSPHSEADGPAGKAQEDLTSPLRPSPSSSAQSKMIESLATHLPEQLQSYEDKGKDNKGLIDEVMPKTDEKDEADAKKNANAVKEARQEISRISSAHHSNDQKIAQPAIQGTTLAVTGPSSPDFGRVKVPGDDELTVPPNGADLKFNQMSQVAAGNSNASVPGADVAQKEHNEIAFHDAFEDKATSSGRAASSSTKGLRLSNYNAPTCETESEGDENYRPKRSSSTLSPEGYASQDENREGLSRAAQTRVSTRHIKQSAIEALGYPFSHCVKEEDSYFVIGAALSRDECNELFNLSNADMKLHPSGEKPQVTRTADETSIDPCNRYSDLVEKPKAPLAIAGSDSEGWRRKWELLTSSEYDSETTLDYKSTNDALDLQTNLADVGSSGDDLFPDDWTWSSSRKQWVPKTGPKHDTRQYMRGRGRNAPGPARHHRSAEAVAGSDSEEWEIKWRYLRSSTPAGLKERSPSPPSDMYGIEKPVEVYRRRE